MPSKKRIEKAMTIGSIISSYLEQNGMLKSGLLSGRVLSSWDKALGGSVARATMDKHFSNGTLYVTMSSSIVRNVLLQDKESIVKRINEEAGGEYVKKLVLK
jgi:predicted nucleic acid-binding Zn ribbon protein